MIDYVEDRTGDLERSFKRLARLQGEDAGFFILAVHSFVEGRIRKLAPPENQEEERFPALIESFRNWLTANARGYIPGLDVLNLMKLQHQLTNEVRHRFSEASEDEARAATQHLRRFLSLASIQESVAFKALLAPLDVWEDRRSKGELAHELANLGVRLRNERKSATEMAARVAALEGFQGEAGRLTEELRRLERELESLQAVKESKSLRAKELRDETIRLMAELKETQTKSRELEDAAAYLELLSRLTVLTRSRADFERMVIRPTPEQLALIERIDLEGDVLIEGSAGTGKSLVLLKAMEKAKGKANRRLPGSSASVALLTYTGTLVKYEGYLASLLTSLDENDLIQTADAFFRDRLLAVDPEAEIDYKLAKGLAERHAPEGVSPADLAAEAEDLVWANDLTRADYIDRMIVRHGMRNRLDKGERERYWAAIEAMGEEMDRSKRYSKGRARQRLLRALEVNPAFPGLRVVDHIFVDEAQDLSLAELKALKACARKSIMLAGDRNQSIYLPGFGPRSAGISTRTKTLRSNLRNSLPIHELAERYRASSPEHDETSRPAAFREGPAPELFTGTDRAVLLELLVGRVDLLVRRLGYAPENIAVLVPQGDDVELVRKRLVTAGYEAADIRERDFDFAKGGALRLSTLHSAKGLDFPVVLLFLYRPPYFGSGYDEATTELMIRNLVYVAMTRAMDQFAAFTLEEPKSPAIKDLVGCFGEGDNIICHFHRVGLQRNWALPNHREATW